MAMGVITIIAIMEMAQTITKITITIIIITIMALVIIRSTPINIIMVVMVAAAVVGDIIMAVGPNTINNSIIIITITSIKISIRIIIMAI